MMMVDMAMVVVVVVVMIVVVGVLMIVIMVVHMIILVAMTMIATLFMSRSDLDLRGGCRPTTATWFVALGVACVQSVRYGALGAFGFRDIRASGRRSGDACR